MDISLISFRPFKPRAFPRPLTIHREPMEGNDATRRVGHEGIWGGSLAPGNGQRGGGTAVFEVAQHLRVPEEAQQHLQTKRTFYFA